VTALIAVFTGDGCVGRCDAKCYHAWGPERHCICRGGNHGAGREQATGNTRELAQSRIERARANGQDVSHLELAVTVMHEPLFDLATRGGTR
jgi:hypothetical protein